MIQILQAGMLEHSFISLEEAPEHRPAATPPVLAVVIEVEYLPPGNRPRPISSNHTIPPKSLAGGEQDPCFVLLFDIFCDCHADPDVVYEGLCMREEDGVDFATVAGVRDVVFRIVSCPGHVGDELAVELAEFHGSDSATSGVVDLLADFAVVPSVDNAAGIGEEVEDIYLELLLFS